MRRTIRRRGFLVAALVTTIAAIAGVIGAPVTAATSGDLFFAEYVEGSGSNKALEIYNGTGGPIDLAAAGYAIDVHSNGGVSPSLTVALSGTVADNDVFVVANSAANAAVLAVADQQAGINFNGNDAVVLRKGAQILDVIGQTGFDPGVFWGETPTTTLDTTLRRDGTITGGDPNGGDAFDPAAEWSGYPIDTFDGLGSHSIVQPTGSVNTTVTVAASGACLQLSTTSASFGTLALGAENQPATPDITVTNCSGATGTLLASGTDATGPGAQWTLTDTARNCVDTPPLAVDQYKLRIAPAGGPATYLTTGSKTVQTLAAGASSAHTLQITTACPGSSGAGKTMSQQINYTVTG
jgi:hypothetical protein